jgi:hypothetical protein
MHSDQVAVLILKLFQGISEELRLSASEMVDRKLTVKAIDRLSSVLVLR